MFNFPYALIRQFILAMLFFSAVMTGGSVMAKTVVYVSDQLTIPMRSGASNQHRIVKFINSGARLTVLGTSEDGKYTQVETVKGKQGWVESKQVMKRPSARERLVSVNKKLQTSKETISKLKKEITELKQQYSDLQNQYRRLENEKQTVEGAYDDLKITASNPIALSRKNKQLQRDLDQAQASEAALEKENQKLKENVMQDWFLIGGGVSIGSLILGLLITRINWKRKRNSWGDSF
ncbi:MAG TPA: TIGR04211 family SH3 domain-containing protein [Thiotrichales bacterium]|nr:TIGR04211 family SH3 domain-containing protein [Thiotrichales bacterium]